MVEKYRRMPEMYKITKIGVENGSTIYENIRNVYEKINILSKGPNGPELY